MVASRDLTILLLALFFVVNPVHGQQPTQSLNKEIKIKGGLIQLDDLIEQVSRQSGLIFSYNPNKLDMKKKVYLRNGMVKLSEIISLLKKKGLALKIMENYIIMTAAFPERERKDSEVQIETQQKLAKPGGKNDAIEERPGLKGQQGNDIAKREPVNASIEVGQGNNTLQETNSLQQQSLDNQLPAPAKKSASHSDDSTKTSLSSLKESGRVETSEQVKVVEKKLSVKKINTT